MISIAKPFPFIEILENPKGIHIYNSKKDFDSDLNIDLFDQACRLNDAGLFYFNFVSVKDCGYNHDKIYCYLHNIFFDMSRSLRENDMIDIISEEGLMVVYCHSKPLNITYVSTCGNDFQLLSNIFRTYKLLSFT